MKIGIIDIEMGNLESVKNALLVIGFQPELILNPEDLKTCDGVILPGVGAFPMAMQRLHETGFVLAIHEYCKSGKLFVGICLGMQLLFDWSDEFGGGAGLGIIPGKVEKIPECIGYAIPHMGWNNVVSKNTAFESNAGDYYFVHSFICIPDDANEVLFECEYSISFCAGVQRSNNIFGFQFHPEKSQTTGLDLIRKVFSSA